MARLNQPNKNKRRSIMDTLKPNYSPNFCKGGRYRHHNYIPMNNIFDDIFDLLPDFLTNPDSKSIINKYNDDYPNYPVSNHYINKEGTNILEIAVPGLKKEDLDIKLEKESGNSYLTIASSKKEEKKHELAPDGIYAYRSLAKRSFEHTYKLSNHMDTDKINVKLEDGILEIIIPQKEEVKPQVKQVEIQ